MKRLASLASALAAASVSNAGQAAPVSLVLTDVREHVKGAFIAGSISSSTATWSYDDVTGLLTQTGGMFNVRYTVVSTTTLFRHSITGLVVGNSGAATATTFACAEGNFGATVGASLCGNYNFGANVVNESTATWGPGTATSRTVGGDDGSLGAQQSVAVYDSFRTISWDGSTLVIGNAWCNPAAPGAFNCGGPAYPNGFNDGLSFELQAVPLPAASWLFGAALLSLGGARHRKKLRQSP